LFEPVKPGDPIVLDEEERAAIDSRWQQYGKDLDGYYPANVAQAIEKDLMAIPALLDFAKWRLRQGDYRGAASTCMKAIGLAGGNPYTWLLLAEVHVEYGDLAVANNLLNTAERTAKKAGVGKAFKKSSRRVSDEIRLKAIGLSGKEEEILMLRAAELNAELGDQAKARNCLAAAEEIANARDVTKKLEQSGIIQRVRKKVKR
jgi:tetratricopeptide (TPR) repeat protein